MSAPSFLQVLTYEVGRLQAAHPDREGELARAHALILHGMVTASPDDPDTGQVLSSDMTTTYRVNGSCSCQAGAHGKDCKHQHAWKLYKYVERKLAAQPAEDQAYNCNLERHPPQPLYEAPSSANVRLQLHGYEVQVTVRGPSEDDVLARLERLLARYPKPPLQPQGREQLSPQQHHALAQGQKITGVCPVHSVQMKENHKDGRTWYSHYDEAAGRWCKGR